MLPRGSLNRLDDDRRDVAGGLVLDLLPEKARRSAQSQLAIALVEGAAVRSRRRARGSVPGASGPRSCLKLEPSSGEHAGRLAVEAAPEANDLVLPVYDFASRSADSTASAPLE